MENKDVDLQQLSTKHLAAIGSIVVNFARLEYSVESAIWDLLKVDESTGRIVTCELSFNRLLGLFSSLYCSQTRDSQAIKEMELWIKKATAAEIQRNIVAHSYWTKPMIDADTTILRLKTTAKMSKGLKVSFHTYTTSDLLQIATDIEEAECPIERLKQLIVPIEP